MKVREEIQRAGPIGRAVERVEQQYGQTRLGRQLAAAAPFREAVEAAELKLQAADRNGESVERRIELAREVLRTRHEYEDMRDFGKLLQPNQRRALRGRA